jgi:hypothetical protein
MKRSWVGWILLLGLLLTALSCSQSLRSKRVIIGSWRMASEQREVGDFSRIYFSGIRCDLYVKTGSKTALRIEADDNILPYITTKVVNGTLEFRIVPGVNLEPRRRAKYYVTVTNLDGIEAWGLGNVYASDLKSTKFSLTALSGYYSFGTLTASEIVINPGGSGSSFSSNPSNLEIAGIYAEKLKVQNNSNSDIYVGKGKVGEQEVIISNEGSYKAPDLESTSAKLQMNGEGTATVWADKSLDAKFAAFSGDIYYRGEPAITQAHQPDTSGKLIKLRR